MWKSFKIQPEIKITDVYSLFDRHYEYNYTFNGETHNFWECVYIKSGTLSVSGNEHVFSLSQGDTIFHKPMELHKFSVTSEEGADLFIFSFSMESNLSAHFKHNVFKLNDEHKAIIKSFLSYIKKECKDMPPPSQKEYTYLPCENLSKKYLHMISLYIEMLLINLSDETTPATTDSSPNAATFTKAVNYMNNNISIQPSIEEIASFCNISTTGLKRIFAKYAGLGIHKYFLKMKINAAIELLKDGHTIGETAEMLGFSNQGYFSFVFKRETGKQPTFYKNHH